MPEPPKAHKRLVPRVTKPPSESRAEDSQDDLRDLDTTKHVTIEPDESFEMTAVREAPQPKPPADLDDLELDVTAQRKSAPPASREPDPDLDDEDDVITADPDEAGETMAIPARVETEPPEPPGLDDDDDLYPDPPPRVFPIPSYAMTAAKEGSMPRFGPNWSTLAGGSQSAPLPEPAGPPAARATGSQMLQPISQVLEPDPNAFSDLEPTALKAPVHTGGVEERPTTHISPAERGLLAAMSEGHEASRKIYMQWLERRGEKVRAEFLKLEMTLAAMNPLDIRFQETQDALREVAQKISVDWRSRVARSLIENCSAIGKQCPTYWRALPADADDVRNCATCGEQVFYCVTIELARGRVRNGQRVSLDVTVERKPDDLEPRCAGCSNQLPRDTRFCPHCGRSTMY